VFDLITNCFYDKKNYPEYSILKEYRNSLLKNKNTIEVTDFGAGSRVFKSPTRAINQIAKNAGIASKRAELLFRIVRYFQPTTILEIGTSLGLGTSALALGNSNAKITTLEGCPNTMAVALKLFQISGFKFQVCDNKSSSIKSFSKFSTSNIQFITTEFNLFFQHLKLETLKQKPQIFDLIYFDGNHSKQATLNYFELLLPTISHDSVWILDDIHWSSGMEEAWEIIQKHPKVTVTIDTFQWGIVFFRSEQEKEHFIIRI